MFEGRNCQRDSKWPCLTMSLATLLLGLGRLAVAGSTVPATEATMSDTLPEAKYSVPEVLVLDSYEKSLAVVRSASQGTITAADLELRPVRRAAEVLEAVPGVLISQHSGEGKANQYYLRGFNLDHGTDMSVTLAGVPVNMPTHGHGQGYADLNFAIPELISGIQYRKGTYFAEEGDFASAGAAHISYRNTLDAPIVHLVGGDNLYQRAFLAASPAVGSGRLLGALELYRNDGPWVHPDEYRKVNGILRYSGGSQARGFSVSAMGYKGDWNSTDQVPRRAVRSGEIDRYGAIDRSDGGKTHRYSLSADYQQVNALTATKANAYVLDYEMNLFSNFTYFLDDPVNGDQFEQADDRTTAGLSLSHLRGARWFQRNVKNTIGLQARNDAIHNVGLYHTVKRERIGTTRQDEVTQRSVSPYFQNETAWMEKVRTLIGLRGEFYHFDVNSDLEENSGTRDASMASPKFSLLLGPFERTELFFNFGYGFHSNDARGSTIKVDPGSGEAAERVTPLVRATGSEVAIRTGRWERLDASAALWNLDLESELLFVGDAGTTEAGRPSRRTGLEVNGTYDFGANLRADASFAYSRARFRDEDEAGDRIPGAVEGVIGAGLSYSDPRGPFGSLRARYFGPRPLIEDNSVRSESSTLVSAEAGYRVAGRFVAQLEVLNLLGSKSSDIDYFYDSRLAGEPDEGVSDIHTHPVEPRALRVSISTDLAR